MEMRVPLMLATVLAAGCGGGEDDVCTRAALHLEDCSGAALEQLPDTCDAQQARSLLEMSCEEIAAAVRNPSFSLLDNVFPGWAAWGSDGWLWNSSLWGNESPDESRPRKWCWYETPLFLLKTNNTVMICCYVDTGKCVVQK